MELVLGFLVFVLFLLFLGVKAVSQAIADGDKNAINYFVAQEYIRTLKEFAISPNQKLIFMPLEASSVIGSIGGIGELCKEINSDGPGGSGSGHVPKVGRD